MKLSVAVNLYAEHKKAAGVKMLSSEPILRAFCRVSGEIEFSELSQERVRAFVYREGICASTRASNFGALKCFLDHYERRGMAAPFRLGRGPKPGPRVMPLVLSVEQVKALLLCADRSHDCRCVISADTIHQILLLLYATGAKISEVVRLERRNVDCRRRRLTLQHNDVTRKRVISFPSDLVPVLKSYLSRHPGAASSLIFRDNHARPISRALMISALKRLARLSGLKKPARKEQLRFQDIRYTFAVHRITQAIRKGDRLDNLLPALSAHMGYVNLTRAEEFLAFVPERFRSDLEKLSPSKGWEKLLCGRQPKKTAGLAAS